jgi:chemotaxis protein methyltransferase CheR
MQTNLALDSLWQRASERVAETMGLHFPLARLPDLQRGLGRAAEELGFRDAVACAEWLITSTLTKSQIDVLASQLTIGETYFFR